MNIREFQDALRVLFDIHRSQIDRCQRFKWANYYFNACSADDDAHKEAVRLVRLIIHSNAIEKSDMACIAKEFCGADSVVYVESSLGRVIEGILDEK